jgi:hypothetical protein
MVINFCKCRKARKMCYGSIKEIEHKICKKYHWYEDDENDPPIERVPKVIPYEAWDSFSIVSFKVNCFGLGCLDEVWRSTEILQKAIMNDI